jgi:hypothetical protein
MLDRLNMLSGAALAKPATLIALRDVLLPERISGELRIADAEMIVWREV